MVTALVALQQRVALLEERDKDTVAMAALAAQTLADQLSTLNDELRVCPGTYWRDAIVTAPHTPAPMHKGYRGPPRESGETATLCDTCGAKLHRDKKAKK